MNMRIECIDLKEVEEYYMNMYLPCTYINLGPAIRDKYLIRGLFHCTRFCPFPQTDFSKLLSALLE